MKQRLRIQDFQYGFKVLPPGLRFLPEDIAGCLLIAEGNPNPDTGHHRVYQVIGNGIEIGLVYRQNHGDSEAGFFLRVQWTKPMVFGDRELSVLFFESLEYTPEPFLF